MPHSSPRLRLARREFRPTGSVRRSLRRVRARGLLDDQLGQGLIVLFSAVACSSGGLWLLLQGSELGVLFLLLALVDLVTFAVLVFRALKRDVAVEFWRDRRRQRFELTIAEHLHELHQCALEELASQRLARVDQERTDAALKRMLEPTFELCAVRQDELAVLLVRQDYRRCEVRHSILSPDSRWNSLRSGKHCILNGTIQDRARELSPAEPYLQSIETGSSPLWFAVLHDSDLTSAELKALDRVAGLLRLLAEDWRAPHVRSATERLHLVDSA